MFGWLKKMIRGSSGPAPGSREYAKRILAESFEAFRLAKRDRPREHYQPNAFSGDSAVLGSSDLMNRRTRDLTRNTGQAKRIRRAFENLVVGKGMQTFAWPFLPSEMLQLTTELEAITDGELGPRLQYALESDDLFEEYFSEKKQFDIEGRLCGPEMYRMLLGESVTVGNGLMIRVARRNRGEFLIPFAWQMFEQEQLDCSKDRPAGKGNNAIVGGIEFNSLNQAVRYHLQLNHPHDFFGVSQSAPGSSIAVEANRVIDLALYDRPSSSLGHSWLDAAGQSIWDRDSYFESELRTAAVESVFLLVAKIMNGEKYDGAWGFNDGLTDSDEHGNREYKIGHSPVAATVGVDEDIELLKPSRPNRDAAPFIKLIDHDIAAGSGGLSYYTLTGDYESTNFTSTRAAKMDEDLDLQPLQQWFGVTVAVPVRRLFNSVAAAQGLFSSVSPAEYFKNIRTYQRFDVIANGRDLLDPLKEGEARTARLRTKLSTYKEECARRNRHWIRELMQHAIENRIFSMFGVQPDFSKPGNEGTKDGEEPAEAEENQTT